MFELKTYGRVMCHDNEKWCKIWTGMDLLFQNLQEFDEFWSFCKSKRYALLLGHLTTVYNVWAKKSYVWWYWRLMQNLKEDWLVLSKMTQGIFKFA